MGLAAINKCAGTWTPPSFNIPTIEDFTRWFMGMETENIYGEGFSVTCDEEFTRMGSPSWQLNDEPFNESSNSEIERENLERLPKYSLTSALDITKSDVDTSRDEQRPRKLRFRLRILSQSRETDFGRIDFIVQKRYSNSGFRSSSAPTTNSHMNLEDGLEARTVITPFKSAAATPQMIFDLTHNSDDNSLSGLILSVRSTIPDDSKVIQVAMAGSRHDLEMMIANGIASLTDCDTQGRSLLNVRNLKPFCGQDTYS
jgi:hypothetical protein